jgi:hypothetical protein
MKQATLVILQRLDNTVDWRERLIEHGDASATDLAILSVLDWYACDLRYRLGLHQPYSGTRQLHRLATVKTLLREVNRIVNIMTEKANGHPLPETARQFCAYLFQIGLDLSHVVRSIEASRSTTNSNKTNHKDYKCHLITQPN